MIKQQSPYLTTEDFIQFSKNFSMWNLVYRKYKDSWLYVSFLSLGISLILFIGGCILIYSVENFVLGILLAVFAWILFSFSVKYNKNKIESVISANSEHRVFLSQDGKLDGRTISRIRTYELSKFIGDSKIDIPFLIERLETNYLGKINYKFMAFGALSLFVGAIVGAYLQDVFKGSEEQKEITLNELLVIAFLIFILIFFLEMFVKELIRVIESQIKRLIKHLDEVHQMRQQ